MLEKIQKLLVHNTYSEKILRRCKRDIDQTTLRLESGQYEYHDYSGKNTFCVDERTQDFFLYLKSYAESGKFWKKILRKLDIHSYTNVVDLCSGWAPKITLALYYTRYEGNVVLVDKDSKSMDDLESFMQEVFRPTYSITKLQSELGDLQTINNACIIANHVFDDLILDMYCTQYSLETKNLYTDEKYLKEIWSAIISNNNFLLGLPEIFANMLEAPIVNGGTLCLSQYESMMEGILGIQHSVEMSINIMKDTVVVLKTRGFSDISSDILSGIIQGQEDNYYILKK